MQKVNWGILGTAKIAIEKVIPAMQLGVNGEITAIASRDIEKARASAEMLNIPKPYGSYEELLVDPDIDAVYIPLPNHLHVPWSIRALNAGKHVLCEKPIGITSTEARQLLETARQKPELKIMEAFMYRHHPQWLQTKGLVDGGKIGDLRTIQSFFSYHNVDPGNIRNMADIGGGGLFDIGCYCISLSRFLFGAEPKRVFGVMEHDPDLAIDRMTEGILDFSVGTSTFTCATQLTPYQRVNVFGTAGRIEIEIPFNAPVDRPCTIWHQRDNQIDELAIETCNQYTIQGDRFARAVLDDSDVPTPLEDALANMIVIEALIKSAENDAWCPVEAI